jgi:hypothetical protein
MYAPHSYIAYVCAAQLYVCAAQLYRVCMRRTAISRIYAPHSYIAYICAAQLYRVYMRRTAIWRIYAPHSYMAYTCAAQLYGVYIAISPAPQCSYRVSLGRRFGNMAAMTTTIEDNFGSGVVVPGRGFLLNNEMTDFSYDERTGRRWT